MDKITGKNNDIIKDVKKLLSSSAERRSQGLFVLEGARLVFDVLNSFYGIKYFFITESAYSKYEDSADRVIAAADRSYYISDEVSDRLSETKSSQGVFAVCRMKNEPTELSKGKRYVALDNVQDPGNVGTILRTAEALGIDGALIGGGCDIYNPKLLRASMGSVLRLMIATGELKEIINNAKACGLTVYATSPDNSADDIRTIDFSNGGVCVIGNEANGISEEIFSLCDWKITIPMLGRAESLNASVAAALTMWEMLR